MRKQILTRLRKKQKRLQYLHTRTPKKGFKVRAVELTTNKEVILWGTNYIYRITNENNGKVYIGVSSDPVKRLKNHMGNYDSRQRLGHYSSWVMQILRVVKTNRILAESIESEYIRKAKKKHGVKCVNRLVRRA